MRYHAKIILSVIFMDENWALKSHRPIPGKLLRFKLPKDTSRFEELFSDSKNVRGNIQSEFYVLAHLDII
jgi:hypothetical protein